ncbi:MAG: tRNA uridine-5-carboxymethylaminomethyl(34) synthesis enzyme MnmG, partial [Flavihumibacter sp.]|nr:tRNA uridine-5-carboxymethylaminomethyl(34) synthesis enzyme MnmG [Flavihumibacter sp.]
EPYRMFTSRAEYRTLLRQDNADLRLTEISHKLGLANDERYNKMIQKREKVEQLKQLLHSTWLEPSEINEYLKSKNSAIISSKQKISQLLLRPQVDINSLLKELGSFNVQEYNAEIIEQTEIQIKYDTYINKERELVTKMSQLEDLIIPDSFNYDKVAALSAEALQKFKKIKPQTLGQASRISGVNPSDVQILMVYMGR